MAFSDWTITKSSGSDVADLVTTNEIKGLSSFRFITNGSSRNINAIKTAGADVTTGVIRTLFRRLLSSTTTGFAGLICMASGFVADPVSYRLVLGNASNGGPLTLRLRKTGTDLATAGIGTFNTTTIYALQLKWQRDPDSGFMILQAWSAEVDPGDTETYDYSGMTKRFEITDSAAPLSATIGAGLMAASGDGSSADTRLFDHTEIDVP